MRKTVGSILLALMMSTGLAADALAQTGGQSAQTQTQNDNDDSGKWGLLGLLGLGGLAGLARRDRGDRLGPPGTAR